MGGGWSSSRAADFRRSLAGAHDHDEPDDEPGSARGSRRGSHCWVLMPDEEPMPGVVAAWRRDPSGAWEGRVAYLLGDGGTSGVVLGWLPASCLRPYRS
ncbi:hypothetical protein WDZ17_01270 [Pseudokineococcus basanitobsidens]|uniref:Uncharacterized protein n=1 Tax=Pseudokineococcus basanitobsidens TaxID=1926649 RepID=A0ABU8RFU2_9ACTN